MAKTKAKKLVEPRPSDASTRQMNSRINKGGTSKESPGAVNNKEDQAFPGTADQQKSK